MANILTDCAEFVAAFSFPIALIIVLAFATGVVPQ
jgi:hypothetical protein